MAKILISGYYGFDNAGDDSVLYGIVSSLRKKDNTLQFSVLSNRPEKTEQTFGIKAFNRWSIIEVLRQLKNHDLLVMGGGSLLQDATSPRSVVYYLGTVLAAKLFGKPVVFYAQGIGPIEKSFSKRLIKFIVNKVDVITVRDFGSGEDLKRFGVIKTPIFVTADPAVTIPAESIDLNIGKKLLTTLAINPKETMAISVRSWKKEENYLAQLAEVADHYASKGWKILFIPMQYPEDITACRDIMKRMTKPAYIIEQQLNFKEIMSVIGNIRFVLGMRLHSIILAAVMNVPFVGISYDPKIDRFVERVNMHSAGHISNLHTQKVIERIDYTLQHEAQIKAVIAKSMSNIIVEAQRSSQLTIEQLK